MTDQLPHRPPREEQAWQEIGHTDFTPGVRPFLTVFFLFLILSFPLLQALLPPPHATSSVPAARDWMSATVLAVSAPPQAGGVYKDFVMTLRVQGPDGPAEVRVLAMRDRDILPVASLKPGERIRFESQAWDEVKDQMGSLKTSSLPDDGSNAPLPLLWARALVRENDSPPPNGLSFLDTWEGIAPEVTHAWKSSEGGLLPSFLASNQALARRVHLYEDALDDQAWLTLRIKSPVQALMVRLGVGNEKAYVGREGWLFYEPGVKALTGPGFLDPVQLKRRSRGGEAFRAAPQPDPRPAILRFHADLAARGIELVLLPTPVKPSIHPEHFVASASLETPLRNRSYEAWKADMVAAGIRVLDPGPLLKARAATGAQYLKTDTHWTPDAMRDVARWVRDELGGTVPSTLQGGSARVEQIGDIGAMLELPDSQGVLLPEAQDIRPIAFRDGSPFRFDPSADLLLLGDSFSNIYSIEAMGWGRDAGFGEQLSDALGTPIDRISRNDAAAHATREVLLAELQANPARLDGKKTVLWQFAERELAVGDWRVLTLPQSLPAAAVPTPISARLLVEDVGNEDPLALLGTQAAKTFADQPALAGADGWLFLRDELTHLGTGRFWGELAKPTRSTKDPDPFKALVDLHGKLGELGIELILMPVPPRAVVYADKLLGGLPLDAVGIPQRIDVQHQAFYADLRAAGVKVTDLTDAFLAARRDDATLGPVCLPHDSHWSPRGIGIAVEQISAALADAPWLETAPGLESHVLPEQILRAKGDLADRVEGYAERRMDLRVAQVSLAPDAFSRVPNQTGSPILILADSHGLVFHLGGDMLCEGAGFADQLAHELGVSVDLMGMRGSGSSVRRELARRFLTQPDAAKRKRVVIYCFAARAFTESENWTPVPLRR